MTIWVCPRLDEGTPSRKQLLLDFLKHYKRYYVYEETSKKTNKLHWHIAIPVDEEKDFGAIKTRWTTYWTKHKVPSPQRSCQKDKTGNYHVYVTKGGSRVHVEGFTDSEIHEIESQSYDISLSGSGSKRSNFTRILMDMFEEDHEGNIIAEDNHRGAQRYVVDWLLEKWKISDDCDRPFKVSMVADIINTIMIKYHAKFLFDLNEPYKYHMRDKVMSCLY